MRLSLVLALFVSMLAQLAALPRQELVCRLTGRVMPVCCCPRTTPMDAPSMEERCCCDVVEIGAASMAAAPETLLSKVPPAQLVAMVGSHAPAVGLPSRDPVIWRVIARAAWESGAPPVPVFLRARHLLI